MTRKFASQTIEEINRIPIEQVIGRYIELRTTPSGFVGRSPFAESTKPKLSISKKLNFWKCWVSDKGGYGAISFLVATGYSFPDAVKELAQNYNINIQYETT